MSIFVSWRGSDREVKNELVAALRAQLPGEEIWESDEGCVSNAYEDFIRKIRQSQVFIVIVSDEAMKPSYVFNEIITARTCEMEGTLNMLVFKITDSPYTPTFEANLNHLSDANHVARIHGTNEGYITLANRVRTLLERRRNGDPENAYDTFLPQLQGTTISAGYYVPHSRDQVFDAFDEAFTHSNVIIATQVDGYGKKCAARQYALHRADYKTKLVLHDFSGSLREFFVNGITVTNISKTVFESMSENELILHKARLLQKLGKDTLIIVPELIPDSRDDQFVLDALAMLGCRVIFITQAAPPQLKRAFPVICVDRMEDAHLKELFFNYYEASEDEQDALSHCLTEFFDSIEGHTKSVEATANFLADEFGVYPEDIPEILQNIRPDSSNELSERIFSLISEIFDMKKFGETERKMLLAAAYFARIPIDEKLFIKLLEAGGVYDAKKLRALIERGWLDHDRASRTISISSFLADVCIDKSPVDEELLAQYFSVIYETCTDAAFDVSLGSMFTILKRLGRFFTALELPSLSWTCEQYSRMLESSVFEHTISPAELQRYHAQVKEELAERCAHAKLRAALAECGDFIFSIMRASTALWTPDADVHSSSVAQKLAATLLGDRELLELFNASIAEVGDPALEKLLKHLLGAIETANFSSFLTAYEFFVDKLLDTGDLEGQDCAMAYSLLCILAENCIAAIRSTPYLVLRMGRAWYRLTAQMGVLSYSRSYIMFSCYFDALCDLKIYTEEFDEIFVQLTEAFEKAQKEGFFLQNAGRPAEEQLINTCARYAQGMLNRGDTEDAIRLLMTIAREDPLTDAGVEQSLDLCVCILRQLIRCGDTQAAQELVDNVLACMPEDVLEGTRELATNSVLSLNEIRTFCEAMEMSGAEDSFRDHAEEYLDYYRKYATSFGDRRLLVRYEQIAAKAKTLDYSGHTREQILQAVDALKQRAARGESKEALAAEAFALVSEAGWRTLGYRHHHVQYMGGAAIADGRIAEIQNGEGKTYTILLPAFLHWLYGKQVHIIDSSVYLTQRNYHWMRGVLQYLGCAHHLLISQTLEQPDWDVSVPTIVYSSAAALMFLWQRHELLGATASLPLDVAIVDEAEQLMVASGVMPYSLTASVSGKNTEAFAQAVYDAVVAIDDTDRDRFYQRNIYGNITVQPALFAALEELLTQRQLPLSAYSAKLDPALRWCINALFHEEKDKDYYVVDGKLKGENQTTGQFYDISGIYGFFLSKKEGLHFDPSGLSESKMLNQSTFKELSEHFGALAGTTATASSMANAFRDIYDLDVVPIPTNIPVQRQDHSPQLFTGKDSKLAAIVELVQQKHATGQPVLLVADSVYASAELSRALQQAQVPHKLLNAKNADSDADTLEYAGCKGAVTVTTALANRGVDIRLGGNPKTFAKQHLLEAGFAQDAVLSAMAGNAASDEEITLKQKLDDLTAYYRLQTDAHRKEINDLGGLCVIGTSCFEDMRTEQQMRGRCGRQGDRGESYVFFAMTDDSLKTMLGAGYESLKALYEQMGVGDAALGSIPYVQNTIERSRTTLLNHTCKAFLNQPALRYRPAARKAILGLIAKMRQSESGADAAVQRYFADSADNAGHVLQFAATGSCPDPVISKLLSCVNVPADIKLKQIPHLLTNALAAYYLTLGRRAPEKDDIVNHICTCLEQSWSDYLTDMERESNEARTFCQNPRQYEKHLKQYSLDLCEKLLQRSLTIAVIAPK